MADNVNHPVNETSGEVAALCKDRARLPYVNGNGDSQMNTARKGETTVFYYESDEWQTADDSADELVSTCRSAVT